MGEMLTVVRESWPLTGELTAKLARSLGTILLLWILHRLILRIVWRRTDDVATRYRWRKGSSWAEIHPM